MLDGFTVADTLVIKAQVQVIRYDFRIKCFCSDAVIIIILWGDSVELDSWLGYELDS